jgi:hypothetical protein
MQRGTTADARRAQRTRVPDCTGVDRWPTMMALVRLKDAAVIDIDRLDSSKTKVLRMASEPLRDGLFRQVHKVTFAERSGKTVQVITVSDASRDECSIGSVDVYLIGRDLSIHN